MEHGIAMESMKGKWASSRFDFGYSELFCIPEVTAVSLSSCNSGLRDSLVFNQAHCGSYMFDSDHGIALHTMQGIRASSPAEEDVSWDFSSCGRNLGYILKVLRGWRFENPLCSAKSGLLSS